MLIDCPTCARSYPVTRDTLGERGRTVVCPRCSTHWFASYDGPATICASRPADERLPAGVTSREPASRRRLKTLAATVAACLVISVGAGAVAARDTVIRVLPRSAALYARLGLPVSAHGLQFGGLAPVRLASGDISLSGTIRNVADRAVSLPRLCFEVRDGNGALLVRWRERAPTHRLAAGHRAVFTASPHRFPPEARRVTVRFADNAEPFDDSPQLASLK